MFQQTIIQYTNDENVCEPTVEQNVEPIMYNNLTNNEENIDIIKRDRDDFCFMPYQIDLTGENIPSQVENTQNDEMEKLIASIIQISK